MPPLAHHRRLPCHSITMPPLGAALELNLIYTTPMDVYDFDGTLYRGDSTADFLKWCIRRYPYTALTLPRTGVAAACLGLRVIDKTSFKDQLYRFLTRVPDIETEVERFWRVHERSITGPCNARPGDLVISASPEFLLENVCARRGLSLIASKVDPHTGRTLGPNCSNEEKVARLLEAYPDAVVDNFYSDSHNDDPLARMAKRAFFVKDGALHPWESS